MVAGSSGQTCMVLSQFTLTSFYMDFDLFQSFLGLLQTCGDTGADLRTQVRCRHRAGFESEEEEEPRRAERRRGGGTMARRVTCLQSLAAATGESGRGSSLLIVPGSDQGILSEGFFLG